MTREQARALLVAGSPEYRSVYERWLLRRRLSVAEWRLLESVKTPDGGYPVPTSLDPTRTRA